MYRREDLQEKDEKILLILPARRLVGRVNPVKDLSF
jgi:hypothetical protein